MVNENTAATCTHCGQPLRVVEVVIPHRNHMVATCADCGQSIQQEAKAIICDGQLVCEESAAKLGQNDPNSIRDATADEILVTPLKSDRPMSIGGWLILPAIGMVLSPLLVISVIIMNVDMLNGSLLEKLELVYPGVELLFFGSTLLLGVFLMFQLFVAFMFFAKKPIVPKLMVVYLTINLVLTTIATTWTALVFNDFGVDLVSEVLRAGILAAIWIPYFLVSKRVKNTFV